MIPLNSKIEKYQHIIEKKRIENKPCDILHIRMTDNGKKNVFLIADMFPITEAYIEREYMIAGKHLRVTQPDVLRIQKLLLKNSESEQS